MPRNALMIILPLLILAAGCAPIRSDGAFESPTPSPAPSLTSSIVWFPPTKTPTPYKTPTTQPTEERRPAIDELVYEDDFRRQGNWQIGQLGSGMVSYDPAALVLAVSAPKGSLVTENKELILQDFYLEITASP
ncbi:MAG: hypothetical protein HPY76_05080, partial [Anaerolineae bacterium]|nr:hypothetical protein [Anaerolineae bacterium]